MSPGMVELAHSPMRTPKNCTVMARGLKYRRGTWAKGVMLAPAILGRHFRRLALLFGCLGAAVAMIDRDLALGQQTGQNSNFERCRAITEDAARLRCFENATAKPATPATRKR